MRLNLVLAAAAFDVVWLRVKRLAQHFYSKVKQLGRWLRSKATYITLHYVYITFCSLLLAGILAGGGNLSPTDCILFGFSTCTQSGLNPYDIKGLQFWQRAFILLFSWATNATVINIAVVEARLYWLKVLLTLEVEALASQRSSPEATSRTGEPAAQRRGSHRGSVVEVELSNLTVNGVDGRPLAQDAPDAEAHPITGHAHHVHFAEGPSTAAQHGGSTNAQTESRRNSHSHIMETASAVVEVAAGLASNMFVPKPPEPHPHTSASSLLDGVPAARKQALMQSMRENPHDWEQLSEEYSALLKLRKAVWVYPITCFIFGILVLLPWAYCAGPEVQEFLASEKISPGAWAAFTTVSMVNNLGMTLTPDSMNHFAGSPYAVFMSTFLAFVGSTGYPIMLRLGLEIWAKFKPKDRGLRYLLKYPRRCYTLLFPARDTCILAGVLFGLTVAEVVFIVYMDLDNRAVTHYPVGGLANSVETKLSNGQRFTSALFQAINTRHTGAAIFSLAKANSGVQVYIMIMMIIAAYPIATSVRNSATYDQSHVAIHRQHGQVHDGDSTKAYVAKLLRKQASYDMPYIALGTFVISAAESHKHPGDPVLSSWGPILFESTSAYSNVGLSLGHPDINASLCAKFTDFSKIVLCLLMLRGRLRGVPYNIDPAASIPGDELLIEATPEEAGGPAQPAIERTAEEMV